jgi:hypothetical protein
VLSGCSPLQARRIVDSPAGGIAGWISCFVSRNYRVPGSRLLWGIALCVNGVNPHWPPTAADRHRRRQAPQVRVRDHSGSGYAADASSTLRVWTRGKYVQLPCVQGKHGPGGPRISDHGGSRATADTGRVERESVDDQETKTVHAGVQGAGRVGGDEGGPEDPFHRIPERSARRKRTSALVGSIMVRTSPPTRVSDRPSSRVQRGLSTRHMMVPRTRRAIKASNGSAMAGLHGVHTSPTAAVP